MNTLNQNIQQASLQTNKARKTIKTKCSLGEARLANRKPVEILPVEKRELEKIKKLLDKVKPVSSFCQNAFWVSIALIVSAIFFLASVPPTDKREWIWILAWTMPLVFLISSVIFGLVSRKEKRTLATSIEQIKEEIQFIEEKFILNENAK